MLPFFGQGHFQIADVIVIDLDVGESDVRAEAAGNKKCRKYGRKPQVAPRTIICAKRNLS
jgi:hypothetical protein